MSNNGVPLKSGLRYNFNCFLKLLTDSTEHISGGRECEAQGMATANVGSLMVRRHVAGR